MGWKQILDKQNKVFILNTFLVWNFTTAAGCIRPFWFSKFIFPILNLSLSFFCDDLQTMKICQRCNAKFLPINSFLYAVLPNKTFLQALSPKIMNYCVLFSLLRAFLHTLSQVRIYWLERCIAKLYKFWGMAVFWFAYCFGKWEFSKFAFKCKLIGFLPPCLKYHRM